MGVTYSDNLITLMNEAYDMTMKQVVNHVIDIADEALEITEDKMVNIIENTPSSIVEGKDNRVDTGLMRDSVGKKYMKKVSDNYWQGSAGWVDKVKDYFITQEYGGKTPSSWGSLGGKTISPMHMLTQAQVEMNEYLKERIEGVF